MFDDYGAWDPVGTPTAKTTGLLSRPAGAQRYPVGAEATADIVELRLRVSGDRPEVTFLLNALHEPGQTVAALAIDTDGDATGGGQWGDLAVSSDGWDVLALFDEGSKATNTVSGPIPLPSGERWRIQAFAAQRDGPIMNVAFRGTDERAAAAVTGFHQRCMCPITPWGKA